MHISKIKKWIVCFVVVILIVSGVYFIFNRVDTHHLLGTYQNEEITNFSDYLTQTAELLSDDLCILSDTDSQEDDTIDAQAAVVLDMTNQEAIFQKNAFERLYPASITTLTTALVALEHANLTDSVVVSEDAVSDLTNVSLAGLHAGDTVTIEQLLAGMLLCSGIDSANVLAEAVGGTQEQFVSMMNDMAVSLGCIDTHYTNVGGLTDSEHYTTAYDVYLVMNRLRKNSDFMRLIQMDSYQADYKDINGETVHQEYLSTVQYLQEDNKVHNQVTVLGGKTGTTRMALHCLAVFSEDKNNNQYISIILKAKSKDSLYEQMDLLLDKILS
jgi:D-alanyl-D-alanine carboxypeptidase